MEKAPGQGMTSGWERKLGLDVIPKLAVGGLTRITQRSVNQYMQQARGSYFLDNARRWEQRAQEKARVGRLDIFPVLTTKDLSIIAQRGIYKCLERGRNSNFVRHARHWEQRAQAEAKAGGLAIVPILSPKDLAIVAQRSIGKYMEFARNSNSIKHARSWEQQAQEEAKDGGLDSVPTLPVEDLAMVAQRGLHKCMERARNNNSVRHGRWWEQQAKEEAKEGGLDLVPTLTVEELARVGQRGVEICMEKARDKKSVKHARGWEQRAREEAKVGGLEIVPALSAEDLARVAQRGVDKCMDIARGNYCLESANWWEQRAREEAKAGGLKVIPGLTAEELINIMFRERSSDRR